jgi:hypothetical protein
VELVNTLRRVADVPIVVLDGGLQGRRRQVAQRRRAGLLLEPFNVVLIAERLNILPTRIAAARAY